MLRKQSGLIRIASLSVCASLMLMAGCAAPPVAPQSEDPVRLSLKKALEDGASLPAYSDAADLPARPAVLAGESVTVRGYVGSADNLLRRMAEARGLKFQVTGPLPHLPLLVAVDVAGARFEDFLSFVGKQFGQRADLVLSDAGVEIRYRGQ